MVSLNHVKAVSDDSLPHAEPEVSRNGDAKRRKSRDSKGRFGPGNAGGPGRPRRAIERDYLTVLNDEVTLAEWRKIVAKALKQATQGNATARAWISRYVLGEQTMSLLDLAAADAAGEDPEADIRGRAARIENAAAFKCLGY
jgi:hypothetical protein